MSKYTPFDKQKRIRVVFLFQVASFWTTWESLYQECLLDDRFETKMLLLRETGTEKAQMATAESFLKHNKIQYEDFDKFDIEKYKPHYVFYQSPYIGQRLGNMRSWSANMRRIGARVCYIPYGIEIADTESADYAHFKTEVISNAYRIYTFSEEIKKDYDKKCFNKDAVRALGLPKFDGLYKKDRFKLCPQIKKMAKGRRIVIWKMHFPKVITEKGKKYQVSPDLKEYEKLARFLSAYKELFFVLLPHPKLLECGGGWRKSIDRILLYIDRSENAYVDWSDDYRCSLLNADAVITDRSAVMVEAGAIGCPVLYMFNDKYKEPLTKPIKRLIDTYYNGSSYTDIRQFLKMISAGKDPKKTIRQSTFKKVIPFFDGKCGERIKDDLYQSIIYCDCEKEEYWFQSTKLVIWGTGTIAKKLYWQLLMAQSIGQIEILAYVDNDKEKQGQFFQGAKVLSPDEMKQVDFDYCLVALQGKNGELLEQLNGMGIDNSRILFYDRYLVQSVFQND